MKNKSNIWISICVLGAILSAWSFVAAQELPPDAAQDLFDAGQELSAAEDNGAGPETIQDETFALEAENPAPGEPVADMLSSEPEGQAPDTLQGGSSLVIDVLELKDMDIGDVLKLLSKKSGLNIISGKNVTGKVTIYLKNVDVRDALRIILESNDLAYVEENGIIKVIPGPQFEAAYGHKFGQDTETRIVALKYAKVEDAAAVLNQLKSQGGKISTDAVSNTIILTDRPDKIGLMEEMIGRMDILVETRVFELRYAKAEDVTKKIGTLLSKNIGKIEFDERSNKLFITDTAERFKDIEKMIQAFDQKHPEVLIEAKIVQVTLSDQYKMGIDWEAIVTDFHGLDLKNKFNILPDTLVNGGRLGIGTLANDDYEVLIEALDTVGRTNILSNPRITVINNEEAKILVGSNKPYVTSQTTQSASGPATTAETVNFIEVGVKLFVTPTIHGDGYVTMKIRPEVSSAANSLTTSTNNEIPIVETSQAETTVMVKDGATIVIGGLIKEEDARTINKVPLLGDVPLLGHVFRSESKTKEKTEIVIFLTPKIVSGESLFETTPAQQKAQ